MAHTYSRSTVDAARLLGIEIAAARKRRHMTTSDVAERAGITRVTLNRIESGDPTAGIGLVFEVATVVGLPLFVEDQQQLSSVLKHASTRLALLPDRIRANLPPVHDDF